MIPLLLAAGLAAAAPEDAARSEVAEDPARQGAEALGRGALDEAVELLTTATLDDPGDAAAHLLLARTWNALEDGQKAREALAPLVARGLDSPELRRELGVALALDGHHQAALEELEHIAEDDGQGLIARAWVRHALGDKDGAWVDLDAAAQLNAWAPQAAAARAEMDSPRNLVPRGFHARVYAGLAVVGNPAYAPKLESINRTEVSPRLGLQARYTLLEDGDDSLAVTLDAEHWRSWPRLLWLHPTSVALGAHYQASGPDARLSVHPTLRHQRWPDQPSFTELALPASLRWASNDRDMVTSATARLLAHHFHPQPEDDLTGLYLHASHGLLMPSNNLDLLLAGVADLGLNLGPSKRYVAAGALVGASLDAGPKLAIRGELRVLGAAHPWEDPYSYARRLELMSQLDLEGVYRITPEHGVRVDAWVRSRSSTAPEWWGYGQLGLGAAYQFEL